MTTLHLEVAGKSDPGRVRTNNEDNLAFDENIGLMVVADGMGGHNSGELASALAIRTIRQLVGDLLTGRESLPLGLRSDSRPLHVRQLEYAIEAANRVIAEKGRRDSGNEGMGTTVVAAFIDEKSRMLTVAHVGDSRIYLLRNGQLQALTQDHSLVEEQIRRGIITAEEALNSSFQNVLTRALGSEDKVSVDVAEHPILEGDAVLLCTDGLTRMVPEPEIAEILAQPSAPEVTCNRLIKAALDAGGADNVTVVVARVPKKGGRGVRNILGRIFHGGRR